MWQPQASAHTQRGPLPQRYEAALCHPESTPVKPSPRQAYPLTHLQACSRARAALQQQAHAINLALVGNHEERCPATLRTRPSGHSIAQPARSRTWKFQLTSAPPLSASFSSSAPPLLAAHQAASRFVLVSQRRKAMASLDKAKCNSQIRFVRQTLRRASRGRHQRRPSRAIHRHGPLRNLRRQQAQRS